MELVLVFWSLALALWTLYLFLSSLAWQKRRSALYQERLRWLERVERQRRTEMRDHE